MNQPTVKAETLPVELKGHWEKLMAEKFPMNVEEAYAYISKRWPKLNKHINGIEIIVEIVTENEVPQYSQTVAIDPRFYQSITSTSAGTLVNHQQDQLRYSRGLGAQTIQSIDRITITDFSPKAIEAKLKDVKS